MKYASLERLVRDRVLAAAAQGEHLMVSDAALAAALEQDPPSPACAAPTAGWTWKATSACWPPRA
jgi:peptidyl-prolyl cis-trans isomerase D